MKLNEIKTMLEASGLPVAYRAFPADSCPELPIVVWQQTGTDNIGADNIVWASFKRIQIDLLTSVRDEDSELALESALTNAGVYWDKEIDYDDDENSTRCTYECEV